MLGPWESVGNVEYSDDDILGRIHIVRNSWFKGDVVSILDKEGNFHTINIPRKLGRVRRQYSGRFSRIEVVKPEWLDESLEASEPRLYIRVDQFIGPSFFLIGSSLGTSILEYDPATQESRKVHSIPYRTKDVELPDGLVARVVREETRDLVRIQDNGKKPIEIPCPGIVEGMNFYEDTGLLCVTSHPPNNEELWIHSYYNLQGELTERVKRDISCPYIYLFPP